MPTRSRRSRARPSNRHPHGQVFGTDTALVAGNGARKPKSDGEQVSVDLMRRFSKPDLEWLALESPGSSRQGRRSLDSMAGPDTPVILEVRVIPRARRNEVGERGGRLLVRTTAVPVDDRANASVCKQVAEYLGVSVSCVEIASGHRSRDKVLRIRR